MTVYSVLEIVVVYFAVVGGVVIGLSLLLGGGQKGPWV